MVFLRRQRGSGSRTLHLYHPFASYRGFCTVTASAISYSVNTHARMGGTHEPITRYCQSSHTWQVILQTNHCTLISGNNSSRCPLSTVGIARTTTRNESKTDLPLQGIRARHIARPMVLGGGIVVPRLVQVFVAGARRSTEGQGWREGGGRIRSSVVSGWFQADVRGYTRLGLRMSDLSNLDQFLKLNLPRSLPRRKSRPQNTTASEETQGDWWGGVKVRRGAWYLRGRRILSRC